MGPTLTDSSNDECRRILRRMELETYGTVVSTFRAQGELNKDRRKLLQDLSAILQISPERHKAEIRRAVNDEKLAHIANRVNGSANTEWEWALEGRRVIPLMPRLLHPTPLTSLATAVSKATFQNPGICLDRISPPDRAEDATSTYVRDPDDEDTLSPVMVPVASPESSCHSNNNIEIVDVNEPITEKILLSSCDIQKKSNEPTKSASISTTATQPSKRARSPSNQIISVATPGPKVRAISPSCIRLQQQRVIGIQPSHPGPKGVLVAQARPGLHLQNPSATGKIRIRASVPTGLPQRPTTSKQTVSQCVQINHTPRASLNSGVKQMVQIRTTPIQPQLPLALPTKESNSTHPSQPAASIASALSKSLPGKANVIVLHKNTVAARNVAASRDCERAVVTKASVLPKPVNNLNAGKMTFPGNVRIITVPSGGNVQNTTTNTISGNTGTIPKVVSSVGASTSSSGQHQKNVFVLELTDELSKSIVLSDLVPSTISSINGTTMIGVGGQRPAQCPAVNAKFSADEPDARTEISFEGAADNESEGTSVNSTTYVQSYDFNLPSKENAKEDRSNGNSVMVQSLSHMEQVIQAIDDNVQIEENAVHGILDPQTGLFYASTGGATPVNDRSQIDIFSTAIASADISLDTNSFNDENGGTRLILTDTYDSTSTRSSSL